MQVGLVETGHLNIHNGNADPAGTGAKESEQVPGGARVRLPLQAEAGQHTDEEAQEDWVRERVEEVRVEVSQVLALKIAGAGRADHVTRLGDVPNGGKDDLDGDENNAKAEEAVLAGHTAEGYTLRIHSVHILVQVVQQLNSDS